MINGFEDAQKAGQDAANRAMESFTAFSRGWQAMLAETVEFSKQSFDDGAAYFEKLLGVKTLEMAMATQTHFVKATYEKVAGEAARLGELYLDVAKEVAKPFDGMRQPTK